MVPLAALAGVLLHAGWKLLPARAVAALWRTHRGEAVVLVATAAAIVATNLFEGVLVGLGLAVAKAAWETSHVHVEEVWEGDELCVRILGNASFLRLPKLLDALDALPPAPSVRLDLSGLRHTRPCLPDRARRVGAQAGGPAARPRGRRLTAPGAPGPGAPSGPAALRPWTTHRNARWASATPSSSSGRARWWRRASSPRPPRRRSWPGAGLMRDRERLRVGSLFSCQGAGRGSGRAVRPCGDGLRTVGRLGGGGRGDLRGAGEGHARGADARPDMSSAAVGAPAPGGPGGRFAWWRAELRTRRAACFGNCSVSVMRSV